ASARTAPAQQVPRSRGWGARRRTVSVAQAVQQQQATGKRQRQVRHHQHIPAPPGSTTTPSSAAGEHNLQQPNIHRFAPASAGTGDDSIISAKFAAPPVDGNGPNATSLSPRSPCSSAILTDRHNGTHRVIMEPPNISALLLPRPLVSSAGSISPSMPSLSGPRGLTSMYTAGPVMPEQAGGSQAHIEGLTRLPSQHRPSGTFSRRLLPPLLPPQLVQQRQSLGEQRPAVLSPSWLAAVQAAQAPSVSLGRSLDRDPPSADGQTSRPSGI
ncbi:hypothetical protein Vretimale_17675, partial [Volvox reticuliferus]